MSDPGPGLNDLFMMFGTNNPFSGMMRSMAQFQKGVDEFLIAVENMNRTLDTLNGTAARVNGLLDTVEEPIKAFVPQVTRTIKTTDKLVEQLSNLASSPLAHQVPKQLAEMTTMMSELARRLQPLAQFAESTGTMFGLPKLPSLRTAPAEPITTSSPAPPRPAAKQSAAKRSTAKQTPAKKAPAKKAPPKNR